VRAAPSSRAQRTASPASESVWRIVHEFQTRATLLIMMRIMARIMMQRGWGAASEVFRQAPASLKPAECAFHYPSAWGHLEARNLPTVDATRSQALALGRVETSWYHLCRWPRCSEGLNFAQAEKSTATMPLMSAIVKCGPQTNSLSAKRASSHAKKC